MTTERHKRPCIYCGSKGIRSKRIFGVGFPVCLQCASTIMALSEEHFAMKKRLAEIDAQRASLADKIFSCFLALVVIALIVRLLS